MENKIKVLFLCTANSARSQMAEALLRHLAGDRYEAYSAGITPTRVHPLAVRVMAETGIDISGQPSKSLQDYLGKVHFGYVITLCSDADARCPAVFPGMGQKLHWGFDDPAAPAENEQQQLEKFRQVRDLIRQKITEWLSKNH